MTDPEVSIIIPVFQDQSGIEACLSAIRLQDLPTGQFEVVVVDNGSQPPMVLSEQYGFPFTLVRCSTPGSYAARNAGVKIARGRVLAFTDADCRPHPDWLRKGLAAIDLHGSDSVIGGEIALDQPARRSATGLYQLICGFQQRENVEAKKFSVTANMFASSALVERVGPFSEMLFSGGDRDWCWRAGDVGAKIHFSQLAVVETPPRSSLRSALVQARRVAAGRHSLVQPSLAASRRAALVKPHRGPLEAALWILRHPDLGYFERFPVLLVACVLRAAAFMEIIRVRMGKPAERR